jgi:ADP-heptose:LPS heptosyltransferase
MQRIAVFRALQLGDLLCAVPALRALRRGHPGAEITLVGLPWARAFVTRYAHLVDAFVAFPGHALLPERDVDERAWPGFMAGMRATRFDLALQMHGSGSVSNDIVQAFDAREVAGFHPPGEPAPDGGRFCRWPETGSEVERCLALTDFLGLARHGTALEFPLTSAEIAYAVTLCEHHGLVAGRYVCIHPGARLASRRWPAERYAALAAHLVAAGHRVAVTGTADEASLCARVARAAGAVNLCGRTSLGVLGALVRGAGLVVCNDTGMSHVAAAVGTRSVVVSCGADPARFAPENARRHRVLARMTPCRPCMHDRCPTAHECATALALRDVEQAAFALLEAAVAA